MFLSSSYNDERPETYFSTLMSHSVRPIPRQAENTEETHDQMRQLTTTPLNVISDKTVLYEQHISTVGPTQDAQSACQPALDETPGCDLAPKSPSSIQDEEEAEISTIRNESEEAIETVTSDSDNETPGLQTRLRVESRISELIEIKDIDNLLPDFALICRDDGSENSLSIQKFFVDNFNNAQGVKFGKQSSLEVFQPHEKDSKALPNLSIFDNSISSSSSVKSKTDFEDSFNAAIVGNKEPDAKRASPVMFTFSSDSDCTSSELFEIGPVHDPGQERQPIVEISTPVSESLAISPSVPTNLMQRKKENLKLNLNSAGHHSLVHSISETLPQTSGAEYRSEKRSSTCPKLNSMYITKPPSQQQTPSTGKSATPSTRPGTSSSTASSFAHPFFSSSKTVSEIQDSMYQDILAISVYDSGMAAANADVDLDLKSDTKSVAGTAYTETNTDILNILTEDFDNATLDGLKLEFFDSDEQKLFDIRVQETPVYLRHFINTIRIKVAHLYTHFSITLLNGAPFNVIFVRDANFYAALESGFVLLLFFSSNNLRSLNYLHQND
ncbi:hypothetical protein Btru_028328 [Bulinus truncatus]|nr:hypothetical protein Btru_028328 [Bulinus truncatus]